MDPINDGCRLCLDLFAECFTTIDNLQLKHQMETVFCFSIEPKEGYCSGVCQSCSYAISEFYHYSEKVRQNQEVLNGNVTKCDPTIDSKITLENIKVETLSDSGLPKMTEDGCESTDEVWGEEEFPTVASMITLKSVNVETLNDSVLPGTTEDACGPKDEDSEEEFLTADSKITLESSKVKALSDSGLPETIRKACESKNEVLAEEEAPNSDDDESNEPPPKKSQAKRNGGTVKRKLDNLEADEPTKNSKQTFIQTRQERDEEDELFNKHFSMICDLCGTSAATFTELVNHFRKKHQRRNGYVVCCNKKLFRRSTIRDHIDFHADPDVFRCEVCGNKYKNKKTLTAHKLYRHSTEEQHPFMCDHCPQSFAQKEALAHHMQRHMEVKCPKCNKMFATKNTLRRHMTNQHSGKIRTMVCDICGKEFLSKQCFNRHMNEHMGIEVQRFQCGICQRWLKTAQCLRNHMNWVHTDGNRELQCDICLRKYSHSGALYEHKTKTHAEKKHECEFCGKKFKRAIFLKEHRTTHTGKALYTCEYCGIPKNSKTNMYQHIKRHHPTQREQKKLKATQRSDPS